MKHQLAYLTDPLTTTFETTLVKESPRPNGQFDVVLAQTYFYPTGGGQDHDTGVLNEAQVLDVFKDEAGNVVHRVDRQVGGPAVHGQIDFERRLGNMQHHTAQHILSCAVTEVLGLDTLSAHINANAPSTIDVPDAALNWPALELAEQRANAVVFGNRPVHIYFINDDAIESVPFRRPPKVSGQIRVVEIDGWDYSACGGTHVPQTGMVGLIKIVRTERKNQKLRLHFVAGSQALRHFQQVQRVVTAVSHHFSASAEDVAALAAQQTETLKALQKEFNALKAELLPLEAEKLAAAATTSVAGLRLVSRQFTGRSGGELRELGKLLLAQTKLVAVLAGLNNSKLSLVVSCGPQTVVSARDLLNLLLAPIGGKGGGDAGLAQGGGEATTEDVVRLLDSAGEHVAALAG